MLRAAADSVPATDRLPLIVELPDTASDPPESCALVAIGADVLMFNADSGEGATSVPVGVVVTDMNPVADWLCARTGDAAMADARAGTQRQSPRKRRSMMSFMAGARDLLQRR